MTLTKTIAKHLAGGIALFLLAGLGMAGIWYSTPHTYEAASPSEIMAERPHAKGTVSYVKENNVCKETVEGLFPTGLIYQDADDRAHFTRNSVLIGKALDDRFADKPWKNHTVNYFCK